jgi:hypothetical protein
MIKPFGTADNAKSQGMVGAIFYRLDFRPDPLGGQGAGASGVWCGPYRKDETGREISAPMCTWSLFDGYRAAMATGPAWLKTSYGFVGEPRKLPEKFGDLVLSPKDQDLIGPMDFALNFDQFDGDGAALYATARRDGKSVTFWRGTIKFDKANQGVLPFWTHRLLITRHIGRTIDTLSVQFLPDGDGRGWEGAGTPLKTLSVAPPAATASPTR